MIASEIYEEVRCTEHQHRYLSQTPPGEQPTYAVRWSLRQLCPSIDRLVYNWQAVASHNPVLRTSVRYGADKGTRLVVLRKAAPIRIQGPPDQHAYKPTSTQTAELTVLADQSLALICRDFDLFYNGLACEPHDHFKYYVNHIAERDEQSALSYWHNLMSGAVTSLSYGFPISTSGKRRTFTFGLPDNIMGSVYDFLSAHTVSARDFVHAIWSLVQYRHTAATDGTVVFAVTGRDSSVPGYGSVVGRAELCYPLKLVIENEFTLLDWICQNQIFPVQPQVRIIVTEGLDIVEEGNEDIPFPLTISVDLHQQLVDVRHYSEVPDEQNLQVISRHFVAVIEEALRDSTTVLSTIDIVSEREKEFLLQCREPVTEPAIGLIHNLFERQADSNPNNDAINFEGNITITYEELNRLSNQVARQLRCGRGDYVPVCLDRSPALIVSLLAILKAGAAYVILDPDSPVERNSFIVSDVEARSNLDVVQEATDICYVIYTSGSTGKPKGVLLEHKSAYTGLMAFPTLPNLRQLLFHNPIFSAAQRSIFSTLKQGGCLCLARKENLTVGINEIINIMQVSVIDVTPSTATLIDPNSVPTLRLMTVAGELINPALLPVGLDRLELLNAYGLSEVTQINWRHVMHRSQNPQNIGRPVDSTRSYVFVPGTTRLAAILEPSELCLGGHQLAKSYLNRPEKTQESFIQNPFGPGPLYRTGDMVVTHPDGSIEMIGRIDFQVKINGQRVEPGECRVEKEWTGLVKNLQKLLTDRVPSYMVPAYWWKQSQLPLNVNGKVDVPLLSSLVQEIPPQDLLVHSSSNGESMTQRSLTQMESSLRRIWAEVLCLPESDISLEDSFMSLGGSSLSAIITASRARNDLIDVKVHDIMLGSGLREVASACKQIQNSTAHVQAFSLLPKNYAVDNSIEDGWPVTASQEPLIADAMLGDTKYVYNRVVALKDFNANEVKVALEKLLQGNTFLRSTFVSYGKTYLQIVPTEVNLPWQESVLTLAEYLRTKPATIVMGEPFFKITALASGELVFTMHHALFDFWSNRFIFDDLSNLMHTRPSVDRPHYNQFVQYIMQKDKSLSRDFWRGYLEDCKPSRLGILRGQTNSLLLSLILGSSDIVFGVTLFGRDLPIPDILLMEGSTFTQVPLRVRVSSSTIKEIAKDIQRQVQSIADHAHNGLRNIILSTGLPANFFDTTVNILVKPPSSAADDAFAFVADVQPDVTDYIKLEAGDSDSNSISLSSTLDSVLAQKLLSGLASVFDAFSNDSESLVRELQFVAKLNSVSHVTAPKAQHGLATSQLAHSAFEQSVGQSKGNPALEDEKGTILSYEQLNERANRLAGFLHSKAIKPEDIVPVYLDKSINTVVAILGIFKAGAAFCALDPTSSPAGNDYIVKKVGANLIITDVASPSSAISVDCEFVLLDQIDLSLFSPANFSVQGLSLDSLAYVLFTSGSTGDPKGVLVTHGNVFHATKGVIEATGADNSWRSLWAINYIFDGSYFDIFTVLGAGGTLCVVSQPKVFSSLAGFVNDLGVTHLNVTPTIAKQLLKPSDVPGLKALIVGGEPLVPEILETWATRIPVFNNYGPTEGTVMVTTTVVEPARGINNIGRAMSTVTLSVMEFDSQTLVPLGEVGELCLSGPQVVRGYLDNSDATRASFFIGDNGTMVYRTGDAARQLPDGRFELFGRRDNQVKVNGFRIELLEVENAVLKTGMLDSCVVLAAKLRGRTQLVAVCQFLTDYSSSIKASDTPFLPPSSVYPFEDLQSKLVSLASYMIPAIWIPVSWLNRWSIPWWQSYQDPSYNITDGVANHSSPGTSEERLLQKIWSSIFECDLGSIGTTTSFYSLGGDSIAAINLVSACRKLGYEVSVADVLAFPSIKEQVRVIKPLQTISEVPLSPQLYGVEDDIYDTLGKSSVHENDIEAIYPCVPGQVEFLSQGHTEHQFWQLQTVRRVPSDFDVQRWLELVRQLTANNAILRSMFIKSARHMEPPKWVQVILKEPILDLETIYYDTAAERDQIIDSLWDGRFKVGKPFIQYRILRSNEDNTLHLYIKMDHAMYDGTLLRIFDDQFTTMARNEPPPQPTQFTELINYHSTSNIPKMLDFWGTLLQDDKFTYLSQPPDPKANGLLIRDYNLEVNSFAHHTGITVPIVFQTAWGLLLSFLSNSADITYDNLLTGRNVTLDNPQLINGNCANFLPFRARFDNSKTLKSLLHDTQTLLWQTTENGMVGLADIYHALGDDRRTQGAKTMFCFQPFDPPPKALDAHMRWIVMDVSQNRMFFNYALMCEVFKAPTGYKTKFQYDSRLIGEAGVDRAADAFVAIFNVILGCGEETRVGDVWDVLPKGA
ncbi:hypothetical protein AJ79_06889 [Helicocarpus griseus UAMH5409]|uniref:Carrier domain-containing protein n=1 Tax=Helicocarpus griseus UAMH5409 TaxID=1447875 RepID=A0A2B7X8P0_9EURO|nr:hypothetical protein AJ79_06889 [Helicocarpus griseus UAMH5409]